jgi:hypothetical protein
MMPAMIMVCRAMGFLGPASFGMTTAFSAFGSSFTGAGAGAVFSLGAGTVFSIAFTGGSAGGFMSGTGGVSGAGETGAATGTVPAGLTAAGKAAGPTGAPQDSQNFTSGTSVAPHCGQAGRASILAPQDSQNFIPGVTGLPHFWQVWGFAVMETYLALAR